MITVSHSFIATANAIRYCGAVPVFVDIDPDTFNIDPAAIEARDHPAHAGDPLRPSDGHAVRSRQRSCAIARAHGLLGDRGCRLRHRARRSAWMASWERIGRPHGDHRLLLVPPAQGDHDRRRRHADHAQRRTGTQRFRLLRQHGMSIPDTVRHGCPTVIFEDYPVLGYNYRMTDVQAAIGRAQLQAACRRSSRRGARWPSDIAPLLQDVPGSPRRPSRPGRARTGRATACGSGDDSTSAR